MPPARAFATADPLNRRVVDQMLIGVTTRQYARSLEPLGADITTRGTSKRAVSRRVVAQTQAQLDAWRATPLDALDLAGLLIDGVHVGGHCIVVALGIDTMGAKYPLGLWEGATENATVCQGLLTNLASRGRRTDRSLLVIVDGAKALDTAVTQTVGRAALVQRCQVQKGRNILEHLPEAQRPWVKAVLTRAYTNSPVKTATRLLQDLARRLDTDYPSAATSVREGLRRRHPCGCGWLAACTQPASEPSGRPKKRPGSPSLSRCVRGGAGLRVTRPARGAGPGRLAGLVGLLAGQGRQGVQGLDRERRRRPRLLARRPPGRRTAKPAPDDRAEREGERQHHRDQQERPRPRRSTVVCDRR